MSFFLVVGDAAVDQMYFVGEFPEAGSEVAAQRALMEPGGSGGTAAVVLARLGNPTRIATRVGTGPFAELALRNLRAAGVDTALVQYDGQMQTSSVTLIVTPDGQRTMISAAGASRQLDVRELKTAHVADCDALVMSAYSLIGGRQREYSSRTLELAMEHRLTTFVDLGTGAVRALRGRLIEQLRGVDYLLMNEHELRLLSGGSSISDSVARLRRHGLEQLVVKVGEMGSIVVTPELNELVEAHEVDAVVDSTGAGDYYTAAFAHAVMNGYDLVTAARMGNVAGALNVGKIGAQTAQFDAETLHGWGAALSSVPA